MGESPALQIASGTQCLTSLFQHRRDLDCGVKEADIWWTMPMEEMANLKRSTGGQRLQMDTFLAWGCIDDFARPYLTIQAAYVARQLELFDKGLVRRAFQPVYWSPSSRTALAESELFGPQKYGGLLPLLAYQL
uniref:Aminoacyl-tRNA synthetase class Ia domain-containing protein n=1 Tax=Globodera rostochiensis TaxID=31243 RepID=A0A914HJD8_GLORO